MTEIERPSWKKIRDIIHGRILDSTYAPGDKLPKDDDLAESLGCSRTTVQRAMRDLAESGRVERKRKGGTHVRAHPITRATLDIPVTRQEIEKKGSVYGYQLLTVHREQTPHQISEKMGLTEPREMLRVKAIHFSDRRPYVYEDRWICIETVPESANVDFSQISANEWLIQNRPYSRCDLRFYAVQARQDYGKIFDIDGNEALFVMERTTFIDHQPITSVKAVTAPNYQLLAQMGG